MKKMQGILSSKGRRVVWLRNENLCAPPDPQPANPHKPQPGPEGTVWCCGNRYSPKAHAAHVHGERLAMVCAGVAVTGLADPWLAERDARLKAERAEAMPDDEAARIRASQIDLYHDQQRRKRTARMATGVSESMTDL